MPVEVIMAESDVDALLAFRAYARMHAEGGIPCSFSPIKTLTNVFRFMNGPGSVLLLAMDGDLVAGVLALAEATYWCSETDKLLEDKGLYVLPDHRGGEALKALLDAAIKISEDAGLPVFITITNARRRRGGRSEWERIGATLGYQNLGATLAHHPEVAR